MNHARQPRDPLGQGQRCELYLRRQRAQETLDRAVQAGAALLSPLLARPWGETVGYCLDPNGHVLAFAEANDRAVGA